MRRTALLSVLVFAALGASGSEKPLAKIGIVSDTHVTAETNPGGAEALGRVRRFYSLRQGDPGKVRVRRLTFLGERLEKVNL